MTRKSIIQTQKMKDKMEFGSLTLDPRGVAELELHCMCLSTCDNLASSFSKVKHWFLNIILMSVKEENALYLSTCLSFKTNHMIIFIFQCNTKLKYSFFYPIVWPGAKTQVDTSSMILYSEFDCLSTPSWVSNLRISLLISNRKTLKYIAVEPSPFSSLVSYFLHPHTSNACIV